MTTSPTAIEPGSSARWRGLPAHAVGTASALRAAFVLNFAFAAVEVVGGLWTNSVAILSGALHDLGDSLAIGISWILEVRSWRGQDRRYTYGYRRLSLLAALLNAVVLVFGSILVISEAIPRLLSPVRPRAEAMVGLAVLGVVVNGAAVWRLRTGRGLSTRVVTWHILEDVLGWVAVLATSIVNLLRDLPVLDPLVALLITAYVLANVVRGLRRTLQVFLQGVPSGVDVEGIDAQLRAIEGVCSTHHTHVWSLDGERHVLTSHLVVRREATRDDLLRIKARVGELAASMPVEHTTVELEFEDEDCWMRCKG